MEETEEDKQELDRLVGFWVENRQKLAFALNVDELECVNGVVRVIKTKVNNRGEVKVQVKTLKEMI